MIFTISCSRKDVTVLPVRLATVAPCFWEMDNIPPSYESAIARNPWQIVAPYIPSAELCALSRVSQWLHKIFTPYLWGNPASHFGTENDRVYVALTRFKRVLRRVRPNVRELTHTLQLPPAQSEIYDGPRPDWLRDVLEQLPNLQSLLVSRLPFFDHMALVSLKDSTHNQHNLLGNASSTFPLRLLIASHCQNATSQGLAETFTHFPHLAFLDLSNTLAARDRNVLSRLRNLYQLQVLKLSNIHLRDDDLTIVANAIGVGVRSLDVHGNHLTDHSVRTLLSTCFQVTESGSESDSRLHTSRTIATDDWPSGFERADPAVLDEFRDESYDKGIVRRLTSGLISSLPYEDLPSSGITHLYIADNNLTVEGLASLIRSERLHVLDAGSLSHGTILNRPRATSSSSAPHPHDDNRSVNVPGVEKLTPFLAEFGKELTSLRLHHTVLTKNAPTKLDERLTTHELSAVDTSRQELEGSLSNAPLEMNTPLNEMDARPPLYELDSHERPPCFELTGDSAHLVISPPIGSKPTLTSEESQPRAKCDGVFAPEVIEDDKHSDDESPVLTATGFLGATAQAVNGVSEPNYLPNPGENGTFSGLTQDLPQMQLAVLEKQRREFRQSKLSRPHGLIPGMVPNLRTLTLTNVPTHSRTAGLHQTLIQYIKDCASETKLANLQARLEPNPVRKSGERHLKHDQHKAREIFALKRIILEMTPTNPSLSINGTGPSKSARNTKSSTEDADSEALWAAAENDFTFFDDEEECGQPAIDNNPLILGSALSEKMIVSSESSQTKKTPTLQPPSLKDSSFDTVQEISAFRKEKKLAYAQATKRGIQHTDGHWTGEIKVVREDYPTRPKDYYGGILEHTGSLG